MRTSVRSRLGRPHAAGAFYSTTEDLWRWEQGLFGGKLLSAASLQKMTTPFKSDYAFGLFVHTANGRRVIDHNGAIEGFNTYLAYYPEDKLTVAVLANLNGPAAGEMAPKLGALAHGEPVQLTSERKEITIAPQILAHYVGTYELGPGINMMITLDGDRLMGQLSGQGKMPLFAEAETAFFVKVVDAQIEFTKDDQGKVTHLGLHQNGRDQTAVRKSDTVLERKEIAVSPAILAPYVGTYELQPGFDLVIMLEGSHRSCCHVTGPRRDRPTNLGREKSGSRRVNSGNLGRGARQNDQIVILEILAAGLLPGRL